jgi:hypothetical protein
MMKNQIIDLEGERTSLQHIEKKYGEDIMEISSMENAGSAAEI